MAPTVEHPSVIEGENRPVAAGSVVELVRRYARQTPHAPAVESAGSILTYSQLWLWVREISAALDEAGVSAGDRVLLRADRTPGVIAAALAVMSLRAAYVPVDPTHPADRIAAVVAGADARAQVHDRAGAAGRLPGADVPSIDVHELAGRALSQERELPQPDDIAYVVFTSGSTGTPKGVMIEHGSLVNYASWCGSVVGADTADSPLFASLGYDLAMTSLWVPLAQGRRVVTVAGLWDQETLFGERAEPYGFVKLTPSHARFFDVLAQPPVYRQATRTLMFGGEGLDPALVRSLGERIDGVRLVNHYGPTETTIGCCAHVFDSTRIPGTPTVPIGRPAWNTRAYVVDEQLRPVRTGTPGELVVAGRAVAAGYLGGVGREKFVDEKELGGASGRAYRTGDVVELLPEGALLYLGRRDDQLKVNGHRVELGELRHHVLAVPGVANAAFDVVRGPVDSLEVFVLPAAPYAGDPAFGDVVRRALAEVLPSALAPNDVFVVPEIVFNANGKADVAATRRLLGRTSPDLP
ncbi:amino acid adenylation domain-containing protein [Kitasatospora sp. NPDC093806]|uniref:amino acid adenylation domain-containing protein n=1 Tax=Kitasatospora sp. NPDC093806 TaxID=3155075 RepID=UPI0034206EBA